MTNPENLQPSKWQKFTENFSLIESVIGAVIAIAVAWATIQVAQVSAVKDIQRNGERIERLEKETVSRELFDERTKTIIDEQKEQRQILEKILEKSK